MTSETPVVPGAEHCIVKRGDGVFADPTVPAPVFQAAVDSIFSGGKYLAGLDYAVLVKILYACGPDLPRSKSGEMLVRLADDLVDFDSKRRALYKAVKINEGQAEYYFEQVYLPDPVDPDGPGTPATLDTDEFIADMWSKGIRFGIDVKAVRGAITAGRNERVNVAVRLDAVPGKDAEIIEVADEIHRSDAPKQLANGRLDLMAFQNRFPQIQQGKRLLKKVPRQAGFMGYELSGIAIEPAVPNDVEMAPMAGPGTVIDITAEGEFLVAQRHGFLDIDAKSHQISVSDKIVSRDGVSAKTTGNLNLEGDYEEFGEVQEKRLIEGEGITIHADVFGNIVSRGGNIILNRNLVGGTAHNKRGDIHVKGVASGAVVQTSAGEVHMSRAESCIISGTKVFVEHAVNCEIIGEDVTIKQAEGCAVAGRHVKIESAGPRKQAEMLVFVLQPDSTKIDEVIGLMMTRVEEFGQLVEQRKAEMEQLTSEPEVRKYVMLASKIRKKELTLTAEQLPQFQKMATAVGPALKAIAKVSLDVKAAETEQAAGLALVNQLKEQRSASEGTSTVQLDKLTGDIVVRSMKFNPDGSSTYDLLPKDIKARLRGTAEGEIIYSGSNGPVQWNSDIPAA